jgi:hypothetical protein
MPNLQISEHDTPGYSYDGCVENLDSHILDSDLEDKLCLHDTLHVCIY